MEEKKKYKVTISCSTVLEAKDEKEAKRIAKQLWDCGIRNITSIDCDVKESEDCVKRSFITEILNKKRE